MTDIRLIRGADGLVDMAGADLRGANLDGAELDGADLRGAQVDIQYRHLISQNVL